MTTQRADTRPPTTPRGARRRTVTPGTAGTPVLTVLRAGQPASLDLRKREDLLAATGELARALLVGRPTPDVLQLIADRARAGTTAALGLVGTSTDSRLLVVEAAAGPGSDRRRGRQVLLTPMPANGLALDLGQTAGGARRVLVLLGLPAEGHAATVLAAQAFAAQTALTFGLADQRAALERERLLQDRHRTATGLVELVVPGLFATGLRLAGATGLIHGQPDAASTRLSQAVEDLDLAIAQVRATALGLRAAPTRAAPTRAAGTSGANWAPACPSSSGPHPPDSVVTLYDVKSDRRHPAGHRMAIERPDQDADRSAQQLVADLRATAPGGGGPIEAFLDAVLLVARAACPSCLAVTLTVDHEGQPVTVTATVSSGQRHAPSLTVRLPRPDTSGPARRPALLVVFATDMVALARLADDVTVLLDIDRRQVTLEATGPVPQSTTANLVLAGQLADRAAVDRALGALIDQGWLPTEGRIELQRRADDTGRSLAQAATTMLEALPGVPPQCAR